MRTTEGSRWLAELPDAIAEVTRRWNLIVEPPFNGDEVTAAWVAPVTRADGSSAVLKFGMPHMEGADEIAGLRFWNGNPTIELFEADHDLNAMLLEKCDPGTSLRSEPENEQDVIVASLLKRLWRSPPPGRLRPLSAMTGFWSAETLSDAEGWSDPGLVREGLDLFALLANEPVDEMLLATDLHAGNILRSTREPWLVIDPKPFVGDPVYDATQHLFNCRRRMTADPLPTISRFADLLEIETERVRLWTFARAAAEPRSRWDDWKMDLARALAPS